MMNLNRLAALSTAVMIALMMPVTQPSSVQGAVASATMKQHEAGRKQETTIRWNAFKTKVARAGLLLERIDGARWVYPDRAPQAMNASLPVLAARNVRVPVWFALASPEDADYQVRVGALQPERDQAKVNVQAHIYRGITVHVEANNNGCSRTSVGVTPPAAWREAITRQAPFDVYDALTPGGSGHLNANVVVPVLVDMEIPADAPPGMYHLTVHISTASKQAEVTVPVEVFAVNIPDQLPLSATTWLDPAPRNLTSSDPPTWWSEAHWKLLAQAGRVLHMLGRDVMYTPLMDGKHPLIKVYRDADGKLSFDYTRFDRWVKLFTGMGFTGFQTHHVAGGHEAQAMEVYVFNHKDSSRTPLLKDRDDLDQWFDFLKMFYQDFHHHLAKRDWLSTIMLGQLDEPHDLDGYKRLADLARKYLPGVRTMDAINGHPEDYSPYVDIQVFSLMTMAKTHVPVERAAHGRINWLYYCCSPFPPYPNTHLDERLVNNRLYPWLAFHYHAKGLLFWAANVYRGANPYKTSIGPLPDGTQNPGHPPGDNWMLYPGPDGLLPSCRMIWSREGMVDNALLTMVSQRDGRDAVKPLMHEIVPSLANTQTDPMVYRQARASLLVRLSRK